jgi:hypothetical protein
VTVELVADTVRVPKVTVAVWFSATPPAVAVRTTGSVLLSVTVKLATPLALVVAEPDGVMVAPVPDPWAKVTDTPAMGCGLLALSSTVTVIVDVPPAVTAVGDATTPEFDADTVGVVKSTTAVWVTVVDPVVAV